MKPTQHRRAKAVAQSQSLGGLNLSMLFAGSVLAIGAATLARADSHENVIVSHGYSNFGELRYPADMAHLDYVNPDLIAICARR